jgi:uncharacterized protein YndB with AHSA1/START domain
MGVRSSGRRSRAKLSGLGRLRIYDSFTVATRRGFLGRWTLDVGRWKGTALLRRRTTIARIDTCLEAGNCQTISGARSGACGWPACRTGGTVNERSTTQGTTAKATEPKRAASYEILLDAPPAVVWAALTEPDELERWFPLSAAVTPGPGGHFVLRWRDRHSGENWPIVAWERERHLAIGLRKPDGAPEPSHIVTDFVLEGRGDRTVLRVVASGFDPEAEWSTFFDGVRRGWRFELGSLKHYLEWHRGHDRSVAWAFAPLSAPLDRGWRAVFGLNGWRSNNSVSRLSPGDRYSFVAPDGTALSGTVTVVDPPTDFSGTVEEFNNGLLRIQLEPARADASITVWLAAYGVDSARMAALEQRWQPALDRLMASGG